MVRVCPQCGCSDIDEDSGRGDATCMGCGTVIEESIVVSDNQFQERAGGAGHTLVGQTITMDRAHVSVQGVPGLSSQESREVTYAKGRKLIEEVASQLRINKHCVETAFNFFKMCISRNLTRGRLRSHVVAACLYMTCRLENTSHLLLDFSDVTSVNVFDLGRTLSFLARSLRINLPTTDPCLYVLRFAVLLDFGDKQKEVVTLATRLVQRMKRDWLSTGRRPTGLCGAALLLAARSYNFNRSISDVVRVVHVSEAVVRKRLDEFSQTPSSALTLDQFTTVDLEHCEDPPAFREARRKAAMQREEEEAERMEREIAPMQKEVERALEKKQREKFKKSPYAKIVGGSINDSDVGPAEESMIREEILDSVFRDVDEDEEEDMYSHSASMGPSLESLGILPGAVAPPQPSTSFPPEEQGDGELDLEGIDDYEIDSYILTDKESEVKEKFWMRCNGEHLANVERIKKMRAEEEARDSEEGKIKKKRPPRKKKEAFHAATPAEAIEKIIHEKKLSNKVNYDILKELSGVTVDREKPPSDQKLQSEDNKKALLIETPVDDSLMDGTLIAPAPPTNDKPSGPTKRKRPMAKPNVATSAIMKEFSKALDLTPIEDPVKQTESTTTKSRKRLRFDDTRSELVIKKEWKECLGSEGSEKASSTASSTENAPCSSSSPPSSIASPSPLPSTTHVPTMEVNNAPEVSTVPALLLRAKKSHRPITKADPVKSSGTVNEKNDVPSNGPSTSASQPLLRGKKAHRPLIALKKEKESLPLPSPSLSTSETAEQPELTVNEKELVVELPESQDAPQANETPMETVDSVQSEEGDNGVTPVNTPSTPEGQSSQTLRRSRARPKINIPEDCLWRSSRTKK